MMMGQPPTPDPQSIGFIGASTKNNAEDAIGVGTFVKETNVSTQGWVKLNKDAELRHFTRGSPLPCVPMS